jgi:hypothetical protein
VLNVRIVFRVIGNEMMYVVVVFPPAQAESSYPVCHKCTNDAIRDGMTGDTSMASIVRDDWE